MGEDTDGDLRIDDFVDSDEDGQSDNLQFSPLTVIDSDFDRVPDYRDVDSDQDGLTDLLESGGIDEDNDGRIDGFEDNNGDGVDDARQMLGGQDRDTDSDGLPDRLDRDADNDGEFDLVEAGSNDLEGNGVINPLIDTDRDGLPDSVDVDQTGGVDMDADGIDDAFDSSFVAGEDTDGDGIVDSADADADGDGSVDDPDNALSLGATLPDVDGDGIPDLFEANGTGIVLTGLSGSGCSIDARSSGGLLWLILMAAGTGLLARRLRRGTGA